MTPLRLLVVLPLALGVAGAALVVEAKGGEGRLRPRGKSKEYREAIQTIDALARAKKPSAPTGSVSNGGVENAAELPAKGFGYRLADPKRPTHFGTDEMVFGIIELAALLQELHPGSPWLSIGDVGAKNGGKLAPHVNHQDGQDVDIAFLYCTPEGAPVDKGWLKCDANGKTKNPQVVFDAARSFEMLALWLESPYIGGSRWILCYDPIKKILVEHGRALARKTPRNAAAIEETTAQLEKLLRQPSTSPHDDHFHVRLIAKRG